MAAASFVGLEATPALLLAVSGGPDSMALMHLTARWAGELRRAPALHVATVDHGLRPASTTEAALVATAAAHLGLPHATLPWAGPKPATRLQERAREARYALLAAYAETIGATDVLTAHHADDQAETVLMRLTRGSGIGGLAGMRRTAPLAPRVTLVRPLLDVPKAALVALCRAQGLATVDDPSNRDPAYARTRLRAEAAALARLGLDRDALLRLARRAARAEDALEAEADRMEAILVPVIASRRRRNPGAAGLSPPGFPAAAPGLLRFARNDDDVPPEILLRLLRRAVERAVPRHGPLRLERLETLADAVASALRDGRPHRATLGGARLVLGVDGTLAVTAAPPRRRGVRPD